THPVNDNPRWWVWALLVVALSSPFWSLSLPLVEVDDARYAEVPREMAQSGEWATPTLDYFDYVEKPPLLYWITAASYQRCGVARAGSGRPSAAGPPRLPGAPAHGMAGLVALLAPDGAPRRGGAVERRPLLLPRPISHTRPAADGLPARLVRLDPPRLDPPRG